MMRVSVLVLSAIVLKASGLSVKKALKCCDPEAKPDIGGEADAEVATTPKAETGTGDATEEKKEEEIAPIVEEEKKKTPEATPDASPNTGTAPGSDVEPATTGGATPAAASSSSQDPGATEETAVVPNADTGAASGTGECKTKGKNKKGRCSIM
ncbi:unnamed protein product [Amoebophrya sp. A120]|nr:unnamed protein product [Amoebophrya sp. A120]|eukprot:GSA120T00002053001.1